MSIHAGPRPAIATFFGVVSLIWSLCTLGSSLILLLICSLVGVGSWLGGPIVGALGTALSVAVAIYLVFSSFLSFVLLSAGWLTLRGDPSGITLHRTWAWISLVLDALTLLMTGGYRPAGSAWSTRSPCFTSPRPGKSRCAGWRLADSRSAANPSITAQATFEFRRLGLI